MSGQGFIGETEASSGRVIGGFSVGGSLVRVVFEEDFVLAAFSGVRENNSGSENSAVQVNSRRDL
jgi:hypothetical protein